MIYKYRKNMGYNMKKEGMFWGDRIRKWSGSESYFALMSKERVGSFFDFYGAIFAVTGIDDNITGEGK